MTTALCFLLQALCAICAVVLGLWAHLPGAGTAALGVLGGCVATAALVPEARQQIQRGLLLVAWTCTVVVPATLILGAGRTLDCYHGVIAWVMGLALVARACLPGRVRLRPKYRLLALVWGFLGGLLWLAASYGQNLKGSFFIGLSVLLALLVLSHFYFRLPGWAVQLVNTGILLLIGLPIVDLFMQPAYRPGVQPDPAAKWYSYDKAHGDPEAFKLWWNAYLEQWRLMEKALFRPDPAGVLPFRVRPGSQGSLFQSRIAMNSLGFRGQELAREKGNTYRIVALGESTTFGCTLRAEDAPWPELLEHMIRQRLLPNRPVEVINAGLPSFNLQHNLCRLKTEILSLKPDLIISYHGMNGFRLLDKALPPVTGRIPPVYRERPLKLLANCEHHLRVLYYRHLQAPTLLFHQSGDQNIMDSEYARAYEELIALARTNHIRLVVANYSMAVNGHSQPGVVEFYCSTYPVLDRMLQANVAHTQMLQELGRQHPEVYLVDTQAHLDGQHEKFIDLCHLTQEGRQQLAEDIYRGVARVLSEELFATNTPPANSVSLSPGRQTP